MVEFNPRDKGNKPGIAIMIAVKKPKKGKKVEKEYSNPADIPHPPYRVDRSGGWDNEKGDFASAHTTAAGPRRQGNKDFAGNSPRDELASQFQDENRVEVGVPDAPENPVQMTESTPRLLDLSQHGVGPARMRQQSERINEMSNYGQDQLLDATLREPMTTSEHLDRVRNTGVMTSRVRAPPSGVGERKYRSMSLPPGMSQEDYRGYIKRLEAMIPKEPAPGKDFGTRLRSMRGKRGTKILTGMPMELAWRLLKYQGDVDPRPHMMSNADLRSMIHAGLGLGPAMREAAEKEPEPIDQFTPIDQSAPEFMTNPRSARAQKMREDFARFQDMMIDELETRQEENPFPESALPDELEMPFDDESNEELGIIDPGVDEMVRETLPPQIADRVIDAQNADMASREPMGFHPLWQDIHTGEPMDLSWRLLKYGAGMDGLDEDGNYPESTKDVPKFAFKNESAPTSGFDSWVNYRAKTPADPEAKARNLANRGFTAENINRIKMQNAAARAALNRNRNLHQPKGG